MPPPSCTASFQRPQRSPSQEVPAPGCAPPQVELSTAGQGQQYWENRARQPSVGGGAGPWERRGASCMPPLSSAAVQPETLTRESLVGGDICITCGREARSAPIPKPHSSMTIKCLPTVSPQKQHHRPLLCAPSIPFCPAGAWRGGVTSI